LIRKWLGKLFKKRGDIAAEKKIPWPTREEIEQMPWFEGLRLGDIAVIETEPGAHRAYDELVQAGVVGFDTESKPTFIKGEASRGPHVAQFSTPQRAYVFMLHDVQIRKVAATLIKLPSLKKVGFGLSDDLKRIRTKLKVEPKSVLDIETLFAARHYGRGVGVKVAVAIAFKRRYRKSKKASTSNWGADYLTDQQILYAANDAYAAIKVFHALSPTKS
jgi:hypothetical protein